MMVVVFSVLQRDVPFSDSSYAMVFKTLNGLAPHYLSQLLVVKPSIVPVSHEQQWPEAAQVVHTHRTSCLAVCREGLVH